MQQNIILKRDMNMLKSGIKSGRLTIQEVVQLIFKQEKLLEFRELKKELHGFMMVMDFQHQKQRIIGI